MLLSKIGKRYGNIPFNIVRNISNLKQNLEGSINERLSQNIEPKILDYDEQHYNDLVEFLLTKILHLFLIGEHRIQILL